MLGLKQKKLNHILPSRIKPLVLPENVNCKFRDWQIEVAGPLGTIYIDNYYLRRDNEQPMYNKMLGTYNAILQNAIDGVAYGHLIKLKVKGPGYKVLYCKDNKLSLRLGYSHLCHLKIPAQIKISFNKHNQIFCYSVSKADLSAFVTRIKRLRRTSPYHAKGVFEVGEEFINKPSAKGNKKGSK